MNPQSPTVDSALKVCVALESETFFIPLEKQCEAGMEAGRLRSDLDPVLASSVTLPRACTLPQQPGVCKHLPWEANHLGTQEVL